MAINVGTFNAYQMGKMSPDAEERFELLIEYLKSQNFNVIGFQEIWDKKEIDLLKQEFGKHYDFYSGPLRSQVNTSGLLVMSEYGLKNQEFINKGFNLFSYPGSIQKGIQKVEFNSGNQNTEFFNIHKSYPFKCSIIGKNKTQTRLQRKQQRILEQSLSQKPTIIVGDFNTFENYEEVVPFGYEIVSPTTESTRSPNNKYADSGFNIPFSDPYICDLILASGEFEKINSEIVKEPLMSDHYLVKATIK